VQYLTEIWIIRRSPVWFRPKTREIESIWIWADRPSSKGSKLWFLIIKANKIIVSVWVSLFFWIYLCVLFFHKFSFLSFTFTFSLSISLSFSKLGFLCASCCFRNLTFTLFVSLLVCLPLFPPMSLSVLLSFSLRFSKLVVLVVGVECSAINNKPSE